MTILSLSQQRDARQADMNDPKLTPAETWQTPVRGSNDQEYEIYRANAEALGWSIKTYEEWLNS